MAMAVALSSLYPIDLVFLKCHLATYKHTDVPSAKFQDDKTLCLRDINLHIPGKASGCLKKTARTRTSCVFYGVVLYSQETPVTLLHLASQGSKDKQLNSCTMEAAPKGATELPKSAAVSATRAATSTKGALPISNSTPAQSTNKAHTSQVFVSDW